MSTSRWILTLALAVSPYVRAEDTCAQKFSDLDKTARLATLKNLFGAEKQIRATNGTKGSYVIIDALNDDLTISFFTSALFDLYPVRKDGPLQFCDTGQALKMVGLGRSEEFKIENGEFAMGGGGAKKTFVPAEMPEKLKKLHHFEVPAVAIKP